MSVLPDELRTRLVNWWVAAAVTDGVDPDQKPDTVPVAGTAVLKMFVTYNNVHTSAGSATLVRVPINAIFDDEGHLATPYPKGHPQEGRPMYRGVVLHVTDDPNASVQDYTWSIETKFNKVGDVQVQIPTFSFLLPYAEEPLNLADVAPTPATPGYGLPQSEAAALRSAESSAESAASAEESKQAALEAKQVSNSVRSDADAGNFDGLSAYQVWLGLGHTGTEAEFMNWLKGPQGDPGNATLRVDSTVGERVYVSAGATEKLLSSTTFMRDVASLLTANVTVGTDGFARMIRESNRATLLLKNVTFTGAATSNFFLTGYPIGFRPTAITARVPVYMNSSGTTNLTGVTIRYAERDMGIINRTATPTFGDQYSITQISWLTTDAWPTAAALAALPVVP
ncbi:hypothetical protein [Glutamicibacter sp.]|uniref:hypothetical protein n=1 Tax=Glutamicibacter sp. TaxID=1931995 RepID=UPI0028BE3417|nr:hypothetical protein [Glutamicibacter sp.]